MKNKKAQHRTIDLPEIEIIDLDKEPLRRLKETSRPKAAPADKGEQEAHGQEADQPSKGSGRIWIYLHILFAVLIVGMLGMIA